MKYSILAIQISCFLSYILFVTGCSTDPTIKAHGAARYSGRSEAANANYFRITIEFGEQGNILDPAQLERARALIQNTRHPLVAIFVHGWKNDSGALSQYFFDEAVLRQLTNSYVHNVRAQNVIGVYIAWRGNTSNIPILRELTFWDRYKAAARLGAGYDCYNVISSVVAETRKQAQSGTILIGHSFGGLVVQQAIAHSIASAVNSGGPLAPADLTLLINPASDSEITRQIMVALQNGKVKIGRSTEIHPSIVSLTSKPTKLPGHCSRLGELSPAC